MRIAVVSCWKYRDAWAPCLQLLKKFWPEQSPVLIVDYSDSGLYGVQVRSSGSESVTWGHVVAKFAEVNSDEPILLLQEDFLLNAPVHAELIEHALMLMDRDNLGAIRLYPCPGATTESSDPYFGRVQRGTPYRTSCQATIWRPAYLKAIAERFNTPSEFELQGSPWASENLPQEVWAFKREVQPWPISYFCSAISRGKWEPAALEFCRQQGIEVDTSMRPIA